MSVRFLACLLLVSSVAASPVDVADVDSVDVVEPWADASVPAWSVPMRPVLPVEVSVQPPVEWWDSERPFLLGVFPDGGGARVEWRIADEAEPIGFRVYRSVDGASFQEVAQVGAGARSWVDNQTGAPELRRLTYRVTALYGEVEQPRESAASNEGTYVVGPWSCALVEVDRVPPSLSDVRVNRRYLECMWWSVFYSPPPVSLAFEVR